MGNEVFGNRAQDKHVEQYRKAKPERAVAEKAARAFAVEREWYEEAGDKKQQAHEERLQIRLPGGESHQGRYR